MHDFAAQVGESVRAARESRRQQQETLRREGEHTARQLRHEQERASELVVTTWERIRTAAQASDGALTVDRSESNGVTIFELRWQEGQPARSLQITVDETDGMIQAAWIVASGFLTELFHLAHQVKAQRRQGKPLWGSLGTPAGLSCWPESSGLGVAHETSLLT